MFSGENTRERVKQVEKHGLVWEADAGPLTGLNTGTFESTVGGKEWEHFSGSDFGGLECLFSLSPQSWHTASMFRRSILKLKYADFVDWLSGYYMEIMCLITCFTSKNKQLRSQQTHQCTSEEISGDCWFLRSMQAYPHTTCHQKSHQHPLGFPESFCVQLFFMP